MARALPYEHPERSAILSGVGRLFELHPCLGLEGRAAVLDLDLVALEQLQPTDIQLAPLRRFPTSAFDVSVVAPLREPVATIQAIIAGSDLVSLEFVRQYNGPPLPDDRKSVSYRATVGADDRTLSAEEVGAIRARIIDALQAAGYELRI